MSHLLLSVNGGKLKAKHIIIAQGNAHADTYHLPPFTHVPPQKILPQPDQRKSRHTLRPN